jgi:transposase
MTGRVEVVGRVSGRRSWSNAEKREILAEAFRPGARVRDVIARREVSSSLIYTWRKQLRAGKLARITSALPSFAEVQVGEATAPALQPVACPSSGLIYIELPRGMRVSVDAAVDAGALARVLSVLG